MTRIPLPVDGECEQPQRGLLVRVEVDDLLNRILDVAERLARPDQLGDPVAVTGVVLTMQRPAHGVPPPWSCRCREYVSGAVPSGARHYHNGERAAQGSQQFPSSFSC